MYYSVRADHNGMAAYLTRSDCEGFQEMLYRMQWVGQMTICCGLKMKGMGMVRVSVPMKMETVTVIGKGR
jgi:hypothetical protein